MLCMVMDRRIQSIRRIGSIAMVVGEAAVAWLCMKRPSSYETRPHSRWMMMLSTTRIRPSTTMAAADRDDDNNR